MPAKLYLAQGLRLTYTLCHAVAAVAMDSAQMAQSCVVCVLVMRAGLAPCVILSCAPIDALGLDIADQRAVSAS